jgi:hypothetical protein
LDSSAIRSACRSRISATTAAAPVANAIPATLTPVASDTLSAVITNTRPTTVARMPTPSTTRQGANAAARNGAATSRPT